MIFELRRLSKTFFLLFCRCCEPATPINLPVLRQVSKTIFNFLSPPTAPVLQRTRGRKYLKPEFAQVFSLLFLHFFSRPPIAVNCCPGNPPVRPGPKPAIQPGS